MKPAQFSAQEARIMAFVAAGLSNKAIAFETGIEYRAVADSISKALKKRGWPHRSFAALALNNIDITERLAAARKTYATMPSILAPAKWRLTTSEKAILSVLSMHETATRKIIHAALYSHDIDGAADLKTVDVFIFSIRKKLKPFGIKIYCRYGAGWYMFAEDRALIRCP
jgi:DNA-binding response OmpR family regulator